MKGNMGESAFSNFLGLKPSGNNVAGNVFSNHFPKKGGCISRRHLGKFEGLVTVTLVFKSQYIPS